MFFWPFLSIFLRCGREHCPAGGGHCHPTVLLPFWSATVYGWFVHDPQMINVIMSAFSGFNVVVEASTCDGMLSSIAAII